MAEQSSVRVTKEELQERFRSVLSLPDEKLCNINEWLKTHIDTFYEGNIPSSEIRSAASKVGVSRQEFLNALSFVGTFTFGFDLWDDFPSIIEGIGISGASEKARLLLDGINISPRKSQYIRQKSNVVPSVIPTLKSVRAVCDLRAIFGALPASSSTEKHGADLKDFLGVEPLVIINLDLENTDDNDLRYTFQLTENRLRNLLNTLQESLTQLEIIKEKGKILSPEEGL